MAVGRWRIKRVRKWTSCHKLEIHGVLYIGVDECTVRNNAQTRGVEIIKSFGVLQPAHYISCIGNCHGGRLEIKDDR